MHWAADEVMVTLEREAGALTVPEIAARSGVDPGEVRAAGEELEAAGRVRVDEFDRLYVADGPAPDAIPEQAPLRAGGLTLDSVLSGVPRENLRVVAEVELRPAPDGTLALSGIRRVLSVEVSGG